MTPPAPQAETSWTVDGVAWSARRDADGVEVRRGEEVLLRLTHRAWWALLDGAGALFNGAVRPPRAQVDDDDAPPTQRGTRWSPDDDAALIEAWASGARVADLATRFDRTSGAITARLVHLEVLPSRDEVREADRLRR